MSLIPVLALDLATKTGWALRDRNGNILSGVQEFVLKRGESAGMRFLRFRKWLKEVLNLAEMGLDFSKEMPGLIVFEQAHHRGGHATQLAVGLVTDVLAEAARRNLEHMPVHTASLKKWATGKGNAGKPAMIEKASELYPNEKILDDNHADALLLLKYGLDEIGG
jgi:Holliday junction resolvasome RuvABC endonuclease subunit